MRNSAFWMLPLCGLFLAPAIAEEHETTLDPGPDGYHIRIDRAYLKSIVQDTVYVLKSPLRFGEKEWRTTAAVAGITAGLLVLDTDIQRWAQRNKIDKWQPTYREDYSDQIASSVKPLGDLDRMALPLGALYLYGHAMDDQRAKHSVLMGTKALIISNIIGQSLKFAINRKRPSGWEIHHDWGPDSWSDPDLSMPSGHATSAFALATVFSDVYSDEKWVPPLAYGLATLSAASRIHENRHWASDVFVGSCIGYFTSKAILNRREGDRLTITPVSDGESVLVSLEYRF